MRETAAQASGIVRCSNCGSAQEPVASRDETRCTACGHILTARPYQATRRISLPRSRTALEELMREATKSQAPGMIEEILSFERRASRRAAVIPFIGPWLVWNSGVTAPESTRLRATSILITGLAVVALFLFLRAIGIRPMTTEERVKSDIRALAEIAETYSAEHGAYPLLRTFGAVPQTCPTRASSTPGAGGTGYRPPRRYRHDRDARRRRHPRGHRRGR